MSSPVTSRGPLERLLARVVCGATATVLVDGARAAGLRLRHVEANVRAAEAAHKAAHAAAAAAGAVAARATAVAVPGGRRRVVRDAQSSSSPSSSSSAAAAAADGETLNVGLAGFRAAAARAAALGRPVVSVSNHASTLDDPSLWGELMPRNWLWGNPDAVRWVWAAREIIQKNAATTAYFRLGQAIPVVRGQGLDQEGVHAAIALLRGAPSVAAAAVATAAHRVRAAAALRPRAGRGGGGGGGSSSDVGCGGDESGGVDDWSDYKGAAPFASGAAAAAEDADRGDFVPTGPAPWLHIFSEGKVNLDTNMVEACGLLPFRWGIGEVIMRLHPAWWHDDDTLRRTAPNGGVDAETRATSAATGPVILPFYHHGMHKVLPPKRPYRPRPAGNTVTLLYGAPMEVEVDAALYDMAARGVPRDEARSAVTALIEDRVRALGEELSRALPSAGTHA